MLTRLLSFDGTESLTGELARPDRYRDLRDALVRTPRAIPRGAGLSYCAASFGEGALSVSAELFNGVLAFDGTNGRVTVEAGMRIGDLFRLVLPRGWMLPVTPGHPDITVGGCVGGNVHGKNQIRDGLFGDWVESLVLFHPDRGEIAVSRENEAGLFDLTVGGFGLTGFIVSASLRLKKVEASAVRRRIVPVGSLPEAVAVMREMAADAFLLYSWHDLNADSGHGFVCAGSLEAGPPPGDFAWSRLDAERRGDFSPARAVLLNPRTAVAAYGWFMRRFGRERPVSLPRAVFPVVGMTWYFRMFGRRGFREYQALFPPGAWEEAEKGVRALVRRCNVPVTLASLKLFRGGTSLLNFSGEGVALALDVPECAGARALFAGLDDLTLSLKGVVNVLKDSRLDAAVVRRAFPEYEAFRTRLASFDPARRLDSALRQRLGV